MSVFRPLFFFFFAVMRCLSNFYVVLRYSEPCNVLIACAEYQDGVREGRGGTGKRERAAKGDGKGTTSGCLKTKRRMTH